MILLNPGPVTLSERVRRALLGPDLCHREPEFAQLQAAIRQRLLDVYALDPQRWAAVLLTGSGTAAVEAMLCSMVPRDGRLLVLENGVYGERMSRMAEVYGMDHLALSHSWGEELALDRLEPLLDRDPAITHVAMVHHETTTGRLNDLQAVAECCRPRGLQLLVDSVSSFGAEALDFHRWPIAACAATANKCLHGVPGTSFVVLDREQLAAAARPRRSVYLDLEAYCRAQDQGGTPFTQSVQTFYALDEALAEFHEAGGWEQRHHHYARLMEQVRQGLVELGIRPLLPDAASSVVLNAFRLPEALGYDRMHDGLKAAGFVIYAGQGDFARTLFRVSTMGAVGTTDIDRFLAAVGTILNGTAPRR